jgi:hypothetical protein
MSTSNWLELPIAAATIGAFVAAPLACDQTNARIMLLVLFVCLFV